VKKNYFEQIIHRPE